MPDTTRKVTGLVLAGAAAAALVLFSTEAVDAASAKKKAKKARPLAPTVTAVSRSNLQTVTAPVRRGRWGQEVRLPGGSWIDCKGDCRETLREETVDFWERQERRGGRDSRTPR